MEKQVYNFEALTKIRKKREKNRRIKMIMAAICIVAVLIVLYILSSSRCEYYVYKDKTDTEDNVDVSYETFADGYLKYSSNGIEFQKKFGRSEWNVALSYAHPFFAKSDSYAVLGDKGENSLILFNKNGKVKELTLKYPLVQATVSDQGIIEVILEGTNSNYIQVYVKNGELIADMRSSVEETGYPVTAAISPDGTQLSVSYYSISGMNSKTSIVFYDFSRQLQSDDVTLKGGFDYESALIPKLSFVNKNTVAAFGNSATYFYNIEDTPKVKKEIQFTQEIESVFENDKYIGYVLENSENPEKGKYSLQIYDKNGAKKLECKLNMNYDSIKMWGKEIIAVRENECTILNIKGNILFQGELEGNSIESIMPAKGWRTYHVIFRDKIVKMKLKFWKNS